MAAGIGHIELERNIDAIVVGVRHRKDLGDIPALMRSIEEVGLLQPITITPDGVLVCGRRRLEAVRRLGWHTLKVWVRSRISDELSHVLAQQAENEQRKPLTQLEAAGLFREIKLLIDEDAERRQIASRYRPATESPDDPTGDQPAGEQTAEEQGAGQCPAPRGAGDSRNQAAQFVTGDQSYHRLEKIGWLQDVERDEKRPDSVRRLAREALARIGADGPVHPEFKRVRAADRLALAPLPAEPTVDPELARLADEALARATAEDKKKRAAARRRTVSSHSKPIRAFVITWGELVGWSQGYDVNEVAAKLSDEEWRGFEQVLAETVAFAEELRSARRQLAASA